MAAPKRGLGKGLGALIPTESPAAPAKKTATKRTVSQKAATSSSRPQAESLAPVPGTEYAELSVKLIEPNPRQPRQVFAEEEMNELVHSIQEIGLLQPIVVRPAGKKYELIAGERRLRATKQAGLPTIPAIIRETADDDLLRDALLENLHRAQLNPLEEAAAYSQLLADFGCTTEELAKRIGRSRPQVSNTMRLLKLPAPVQRRVAAGVLSAGHARALLGVESPEAQEALADRIVKEGLSVRSVEEIVLLGEADGKERVRKKRTRGKAQLDPELADFAAEMEERVATALDTRAVVAVPKTKKSRGKIVIEFADAEDLRRIVDAISE